MPLRLIMCSVWLVSDHMSSCHWRIIIIIILEVCAECKIVNIGQQWQTAITEIALVACNKQCHTAPHGLADLWVSFTVAHVFVQFPHRVKMASASSSPSSWVPGKPGETNDATRWPNPVRAGSRSRRLKEPGRPAQRLPSRGAGTSRPST